MNGTDLNVLLWPGVQHGGDVASVMDGDEESTGKGDDDDNL